MKIYGNNRISHFADRSPSSEMKLRHNSATPSKHLRLTKQTQAFEQTNTSV